MKKAMDEYAHYVESPSFIGASTGTEAPVEKGAAIGSPRQKKPKKAPMPVYRSRSDAPLDRQELVFKYHPAKDRYLVCWKNADGQITYKSPGTELKANMIYELTVSQHEKIKAIQQDWLYIARTERRMDKEIVGGLARKLFGENTQVVFSDGAPQFHRHSYERLIDRETIHNFTTGIIWQELSELLVGEMCPEEFEVFFDGRAGGDKTDVQKERESVRDVIVHFMLMDYAQRVLQLPEMDPYKDTLLFVRSCGGFKFEHPAKLVIYDYPTSIHISRDFGAKPVLHNEEGPAIGYADGSGEFVIEGYTFERWHLERRDLITTHIVEDEQNMERRRILTNLMGIGRFLQETGAKVIDMDSVRVMTVGDDDRRMPRALIRGTDGRQFLCGTDGSTKRVYYMPVSREVTTCRMAHESIAGDVGRRQRGPRGVLALGLDEDNCIAQS